MHAVVAPGCMSLLNLRFSKRGTSANNITNCVWQPQRPARSKRPPNTPSDGSKTQWIPDHQVNGYQPGIQLEHLTPTDLQHEVSHDMYVSKDCTSKHLLLSVCVCVNLLVCKLVTR